MLCVVEVTINHLQKELGFDDDVAEWLLVNPSGTDFVNQFDVEDVELIEKTIVVVDDSGIAHVLIPPIDFTQSTKSEFYGQVTMVTRKVNLLFCKINEYEPIDWRDYFYNIGSSYERKFSFQHNSCEMYLELTFHYGDNYIMNTSPCQSNYGGPNPNDYYYEYCVYKNPQPSFGIPMFRIISPPACLSEIEDYFVSPTCP